MMFGLVRIPIWPGEKDSEVCRNPGEDGSGGPDIKEVSNTGLS